MDKRPDEPTTEQPTEPTPVTQKPAEHSPGPEGDAAQRGYMGYVFVLVLIIGALALWAFTR